MTIERPDANDSALKGGTELSVAVPATMEASGKSALAPETAGDTRASTRIADMVEAARKFALKQAGATSIDSSPGWPSTNPPRNGKRRGVARPPLDNQPPRP
ncbi:hypothetical protein HY024_03575 [Candidatus Curtissbacteria bacterium]|nr:hypothetical protein [Candidatus Curtissbacteria bacterium]